VDRHSGNHVKSSNGDHNAEDRTYEDLEDKLKDVIDWLRKRGPHSDILAYLKAKDINEFQFRKIMVSNQVS